MAIAQHRWAGQALTNLPRTKLKLHPVEQVLFTPEPGHVYGGKTLATTPASDVYHKYQKGIEWMGMNRVPMQDWDFPDPAHPAPSVTIKNLGDAYEAMKDHVGRNPDSRWRMYLTPGGVRAWNLTENISPASYVPAGGDDAFMPYSKYLQEELGSDPLYEWYSRSSDIWSSRLSAKPNRLNDFVAYRLNDMGTGIPNPANVDLVTRYHDIPIIENRYVSGMSEKTPAMVRQLLHDQLRGLPSHFVDPIHQRLASQGML